MYYGYHFMPLRTIVRAVFCFPNISGISTGQIKTLQISDIAILKAMKNNRIAVTNKDVFNIA